MVWQKHDSAYLGATVAAGAIAAYVFSSNLGVGPGSPKSGSQEFGHLPVPLVAPAPRHASPERAHLRIVIERELVGLPGALLVTAPPFPSVPPTSVMAPPPPPVPSIEPSPSPVPVTHHRGPKPKKAKKAHTAKAPKPKADASAKKKARTEPGGASGPR